MTSQSRCVGSGAASGTQPTPPDAWRPTWVEVDLDAVAANVAALKAQAAAPGLMAVVKADGYGHGMVPVANAALAGGADWLAVALVEEGQSLRAAGVDAPVLLLVEPPVAAIPALLDAGLTPTVYSPPFVEALSRAALDRSGEPVAVHLKLDTGMGRVGVPRSCWEDALRQVKDAPSLRMEGLWSHLAMASEPGHPFTAQQARQFRRGVDLAARLGLRPDLIHLCNSGGALFLHEEQHDMVRTGIAIYGLEPAPGVAHGCPLRPALSFRSRLSFVKPVPAGQAVSYGLRWAPKEDAIVGTVPAGYADGVVRALSNRGEVVLHGRRVPIVGTVCMDQFLIDATGLDARAGDDVVLIGAQDGSRVTADDWAAWLGTINYEVVCGIGKRVPRLYIGG